MTGTPRNPVSLSLPGVSVETGEQRRVSCPVSNGPAAFSVAPNQTEYAGTHLRALSESMGSSLVPSSGVEVKAGYLAASLDVHEPNSVDLPPRRPVLHDVLDLAEFDPTTSWQSADVISNLQAAIPWEFGNQSSESISAPPCRSRDSKLACILPSNTLTAARTAPDCSLSGWLGHGPEVQSPLQEIKPFTEAEDLRMLDQLLNPQRPDRSLESNHTSPQLYQPNNLEAPNAHIPSGSAQSASANQTSISAGVVTQGQEQGRVSRNRLLQHSKKTDGRLRQICPSPRANASSSAQVFRRTEEQSRNHLKSERLKRKQMNEMYGTIRSLLPPSFKETRPEKATTVMNITNYIKQCKNELEVLEAHLNLSQKSATTSEPRLATFLGSNVAISYCQNSYYSVTVSSPHLGKAAALLARMITAIEDHQLEVLLTSVVTTADTHVYSLQCKASSDAEVLGKDLQSVLQGIVDDFPSTKNSPNEN